MDNEGNTLLSSFGPLVLSIVLSALIVYLVGPPSGGW